MISFSELLTKKGNLREVADGYLASYVENGDNDDDDLHKCIFTIDEIARADARLPSAIAVMLGTLNSSANPRSMIYIQWLSDTLKHWDSPIKMTDIYNDTFYIKDITDIHMFTPGDEKVNLICHYYTPYTHRGIDYAMEAEWDQLIVPVSEVDKYYPGWCQKYEIMKTLEPDVPTSNLLPFVFQTQNTCELMSSALPTNMPTGI